ncbi:hypothetical protein JG688_00000653 [Phytophthora aleatoria]|uniref:Uncharacterized protein n=1 Tax=Phytophthora aleatoria TaxID=2496075 RepID=A0A8J5MJ38_9STRA|nr:hypothetical protein JG688_00000653 [Phytophthora aleatoria]
MKTRSIVTGDFGHVKSSKLLETQQKNEPTLNCFYKNALCVDGTNLQLISNAASEACAAGCTCFAFSEKYLKTHSPWKEPWNLLENDGPNARLSLQSNASIDVTASLSFVDNEQQSFCRVRLSASYIGVGVGRPY